MTLTVSMTGVTSDGDVPIATVEFFGAGMLRLFRLQRPAPVDVGREMVR